jgi:hypothetical protein
MQREDGKPPHPGPSLRPSSASRPNPPQGGRARYWAHSGQRHAAFAFFAVLGVFRVTSFLRGFRQAVLRRVSRIDPESRKTGDETITRRNVPAFVPADGDVPRFDTRLPRAVWPLRGRRSGACVWAWGWGSGGSARIQHGGRTEGRRATEADWGTAPPVGAS